MVAKGNHVCVVVLGILLIIFMRSYSCQVLPHPVSVHVIELLYIIIPATSGLQLCEIVNDIHLLSGLFAGVLPCLQAAATYL